MIATQNRLRKSRRRRWLIHQKALFPGPFLTPRVGLEPTTLRLTVSESTVPKGWKRDTTGDNSPCGSAAAERAGNALAVVQQAARERAPLHVPAERDDILIRAVGLPRRRVRDGHADRPAVLAVAIGAVGVGRDGKDEVRRHRARTGE